MAMTAWTAGQRITAARLNDMTAIWASWTPTWTTSTGANTPSFGNASITAQYCQTGNIVFIRLQIQFGSTTNFGGGGVTDNWRFSLPVTANAAELISGMGTIQDSATGGSPSSNRAPVRVRLTTTTDLELETAGAFTGEAGGAYNTTSVGLVDAVTPWTWAQDDWVRINARYAAA